MSLVICPKCRKRYDPGSIPDPDTLGGSLSVKVVCPLCGQWLRLPEYDAVPPPNAPKELLDEMKRQSTPVGDDDPRPVKWGGKPKKTWWKFW